jgi:hypothetical protein
LVERNVCKLWNKNIIIIIIITISVHAKVQRAALKAAFFIFKHLTTIASTSACSDGRSLLLFFVYRYGQKSILVCYLGAVLYSPKSLFTPGFSLCLKSMQGRTGPPGDRENSRWADHQMANIITVSALEHKGPLSTVKCVNSDEIKCFKIEAI